jgi:hypothetical protein
MSTKSLGNKIFQQESLKNNIIANLIGKVWVMIVGIVFVPVYIHFIV